MPLGATKTLRDNKECKVLMASTVPPKLQVHSGVFRIICYLLASCPTSRLNAWSSAPSRLQAHDVSSHPHRKWSAWDTSGLARSAQQRGASVQNGAAASKRLKRHATHLANDPTTPTTGQMISLVKTGFKHVDSILVYLGVHCIGRPPSMHSSRTVSPMRTWWTCTCQYPNSGFATGTQLKPVAAFLSSWPPKEILLWPWSVRAKNTEKRCTGNAICWKKLKPGPKERASKPRPRMPSKWKRLNGWSLMSLATTMFTVAQPRSSSIPLRQALSLTKVPVTLPVPKVMLTECWDTEPLGSVVPSCSIGIEVSDFVSLYPQRPSWRIALRKID